ncbi:hypothetical protein KUIN1_12030 [Pseudomonas sp. KUIN-1]|nr:hypothetical protein KUIN1_12030 [Pseudomonas sp. KUIN-1]
MFAHELHVLHMYFGDFAMHLACLGVPVYGVANFECGGHSDVLEWGATDLQRSLGTVRSVRRGKNSLRLIMWLAFILLMYLQSVIKEMIT